MNLIVSIKLLEIDSMRAQRPLVGPLLTAQHRAAQLAFVREHQNWQVCQWHIVSLCDRCEKSL